MGTPPDQTERWVSSQTLELRLSTALRFPSRPSPYPGHRLVSKKATVPLWFAAAKFRVSGGYESFWFMIPEDSITSVHYAPPVSDRDHRRGGRVDPIG